MTNAPDKPTGPTLQDVLASYGEVETAPLTRIQAFTVKAMTRSWTTIPHVTHNDRIDVTVLEETRKRANAGRDAGERLSPLPYLMKATAAVLRQLPRFNAALDDTTNTLVLRKYVNLGVAIDTPAGLLVGVVRGCDERSVEDLGAQAKLLSEKARTKGLALTEMSGSGFTISSLGALGGDGFSPIINAPEVAILGVGRLSETPRRTPEGFEWRSLLPVSLSYDHRVVNGADAGRFMQALQAEMDRLSLE